MNTSKKTERTKKMIGICLDCFVEKGLTVTTTTDLCNANNLQNGGIYYYFDTKEEMVLACAEEAISRIEQGAFGIAFEDIQDVANMMHHLSMNCPRLCDFWSAYVCRKNTETKSSRTLYSLQVATLITREKLPRFSAAPQRK